jgi:hypothetical protein
MRFIGACLPQVRILARPARGGNLPADTCLAAAKPAAKPRAERRKLVVLVGTLKALAIAVRNMDARRRVTLLRQRLQAFDGGPALDR